MDVQRHLAEGAFPVVYPNLRDRIFSDLKLKRLMTSVAFLNSNQKKQNVHKLMKFDKEIFLDCGIFQRGFYKTEFTWEKVSNYREKLIDWYSFLKPDFASSFDLPCSLDSQNRIKLKRLEWSIENFKIMNHALDIPLFLGINAFSKDEVILAAKTINIKLGRTPELIGLGGMVPLMRSSKAQPGLGKLILSMIHMIRTKFPSSSLHIYGFGDHKWYPLIRLLGASSSDYAGYISIASRGGILLPGLSEKYILKKIVRLRTKKGVTFYTRADETLFTKDELQKLQNCGCPFCRNSDPVLLEFSREGRIIHNLHVILSENEIVDAYCRENDLEGLRNHVKERFSNEKNDMKNLANHVFCLIGK